jgi:predicted RNA-binding Zn-ribbon protein involved in translation (DUF1610 family)
VVVILRLRRILRVYLQETERIVFADQYRILQPAMGFSRGWFFFVEDPMYTNASKKYHQDDPDTDTYEKINKRRSKHKPYSQPGRKGKEYETHFRCVNCGSVVTTDKELAGVNNRNHCPNCLWSKHVDEFKIGDRKATCGARMRPIGLTVKKNHKKYVTNAHGELMLIHHCTGCGKLSINRIASDDSTGALIALYRQAGELANDLLLELAAQGIHSLSAADVTTVFSQLFGWQLILDEFEPEPQAKMKESILEKSVLEE